MSYGQPVEVCGSVWFCGALNDYRFDYSRGWPKRIVDLEKQAERLKVYLTTVAFLASSFSFLLKDLGSFVVRKIFGS